MGIFSFDKANREQELQNELDSINILMTQKEVELKKIRVELENYQKEQNKQSNIMDHLLEQRNTLEKDINNLNHKIIELKQEKDNLKNENTGLLAKIEKLLERISKKDESIKEEQRKKGKYRFYFEHGAMDFSKAIALFNSLTDSNLSETKVRTYLVQNNIIYKAGRYYAPTPYAEDFNYVVVYGEYGTTAPKYTFEFLIYLKQKVNEGEL